MKKITLFLICFVCTILYTSCGTTYYVPRRGYDYKTKFTKTYTDKTVYRPGHYRNFVNENSQYLNDPVHKKIERQNNNTDRVVYDDMYKANTYVDAHTETGKPVYHTTYTTSYNDNGEVTTTYTTDYVGTKKEVQYWAEVKKEQKKMYDESRKKRKIKIKEPDD